MEKIILASNSPRRKEILRQFNIEFTTAPSNCEEIYSKQYDEKIVKENSLKKASAVGAVLSGIILAADTVVILNSVCLVKPQSPFEAFFMLKKLSGKTHSVVTSHTVINTYTNKSLTEISTSYVTFRKLSAFDIIKYIICKKPTDKAGSYGIQDFMNDGKFIKGSFIEKLDGSFYNVVGLDIELVKDMLNKIL